MSAKRIRMPLIILVLVFAAASLWVCGCGSNTNSSTDSNNAGTRPKTTAQSSAQQPQGTAPTTPAGPSKSKQAFESAKADGKPVLLCFHSLTCAPCIQIEANINQVKQEYQGRVEFVIVDVYDPAEYDFCMEYNIRTIPTTIFIKNDGQVKDSYVGVLTPDQLREKVNALI